MESPKVSIILPVLNEEPGIAKTLQNIKLALKERATYEIICVDNGCTDSSMDIAREYGAKVVRQGVKGYGSAIMSGFETARGEYLFTIDADCTYDFNDAIRMLESLEKDSDLCIGNRYSCSQIKQVYAYHRSIGNKLLTRLINTKWGLSINDSNCGLRGIRKKSLSLLNLQARGMDFASELIIKAAQAGMKISQTPITYNYRIGNSKLNSLVDGLAHLRLILAQNR